MKEKKDIGQSYLNQLGIDSPKESKMLYFQFSAKFGETKGRGMLTDLYRKIREYETNGSYLDEFYEMKNETLEKALLFNGGYQADAYRQQCNWIIENHDLFGREILDAGCECGVLSCFLAMVFPNSHITAVDQSENAIKAAKKLAEKLEVSNITFIHGKLEELQGKQFDTVFASRLLQENCEMGQVMSEFKLLKEEAEEFSENIKDFAKLMADLVAEDGFFISSERCDVDPIFLGWMQRLNICGLAGVPECYKELTVKEMENQGRMQMYTARKSGMEDAEEVYRFWCACQIAHTDLVKNGQYTGWYADMILQNFGKSVLYGFIMINAEGNQLLTYSLWNQEDSSQLMLYQAMGDEHILSLFEEEEKDSLIKQLEDLQKEYKASGLRAKQVL